MMKQHAVDMCSSILDFRQAQHQVIKGCAVGSHLPATDSSPSPVCAPQRIRRNKSRTSAYPATSPASARDFCAYWLVDFILVRVGDHRFGMGFKPAEHM